MFEIDLIRLLINTNHIIQKLLFMILFATSAGVAVAEILFATSAGVAVAEILLTTSHGVAVAEMLLTTSHC